MARKSLSRSTAQALGPIVVPLVTKVALPLAIESLRRGGKFDTDRFYAEAKESLAKGFEKSRPELDDLKDQLADRGSDLYGEIRKQGAALLETLTETRLVARRRLGGTRAPAAAPVPPRPRARDPRGDRRRRRARGKKVRRRRGGAGLPPAFGRRCLLPRVSLRWSAVPRPPLQHCD